MKNKLVFRILGALASALIIASVFIPFVSVAGYSQSLWQTHNAVGTIYLPIMIIVFGVVGVLVFSTGFKTELAYASAGGLLFFLIMQTVPVIDQNLFNTLGVGYYCLAIGTLLIIIMAFICGLRVKQKVVKENVVEDIKQESMIDQIDKLYSDQSENQNLNESDNLNNIIQPLAISDVSQESVDNNIKMSVNVPNSEPVSLQNLDFMSPESAGNSEENQSENVNSTNNSEKNIDTISSDIVQTSVVSEFSVPTQNTVSEMPMPSIETQTQNPVVSEFSVPTQNTVSEIPMPSIETQTQNPVVSEFNVPTQNTVSEIPMPSMEGQAQNPVIAEFNSSIPPQSSFIFNNNSAELHNSETMKEESSNDTNTIEPIKPLDSDKKIDVMGESTNNSSNLDIFG